jgi:hypothetical protein
LNYVVPRSEFGSEKLNFPRVTPSADQCLRSNQFSGPPQWGNNSKRSFGAFSADEVCSSVKQEVELGSSALTKPKVLDKDIIANNGAHVLFLIDNSSSMKRTLGAITAKERKEKRRVGKKVRRARKKVLRQECVKNQKDSSNKKIIDAAFDCMVDFVSRQLKESGDNSRDVYSVVTFNDKGYIFVWGCIFQQLFLYCPCLLFCSSIDLLAHPLNTKLMSVLHSLRNTLTLNTAHTDCSNEPVNWACSACTFLNSKNSALCKMCGQQPPARQTCLTHQPKSISPSSKSNIGPKVPFAPPPPRAQRPFAPPLPRPPRGRAKN